MDPKTLHPLARVRMYNERIITYHSVIGFGTTGNRGRFWIQDLGFKNSRASGI